MAKVRVRATAQGWDGYANVMREPGDVFTVDESIFTGSLDNEGNPRAPSWFERFEGKPGKAAPAQPAQPAQPAEAEAEAE